MTPNPALYARFARKSAAEDIWRPLLASAWWTTAASTFNGEKFPHIAPCDTIRAIIGGAMS